MLRLIPPHCRVQFVEGEPVFGDPAKLDESARTVVWLGTKPPAFREAPESYRATPFFTLFEGSRLEPGAHALVYTGKRADGGFMALLSDEAGQVAAVARKVPHYGKYSYLAFEKGKNVLKGNWKATAGPLHRELDAPVAAGAGR